MWSGHNNFQLAMVGVMRPHLNYYSGNLHIYSHCRNENPHFTEKRHVNLPGVTLLMCEMSMLSWIKPFFLDRTVTC